MVTTTISLQASDVCRLAVRSWTDQPQSALSDVNANICATLRSFHSPSHLITEPSTITESKETKTNVYVVMR